MRLLLHILFIVSTLMVISPASHAQDELSDFVKRQNAKLDLSKEDALQAPNTNVSMVPPENFELNPTTNGFIHEGSATTIQIMEINNVSAESITKSLNAEYFENQGFKLESKQEIQLNDGGSATVYVTYFNVNGEEFYRLFFFTGNEKTIWINVNFPAIVKGLLQKPIIASLKTVKQQSL
ncbi:MAG: hypothetical protein PF448_13885 [Bacteroidales bacterium]|jgi:hypothetical protein|nr:hypothetical protein [Bacteroidales bacterium]